jgi:hypothetical protein
MNQRTPRGTPDVQQVEAPCPSSDSPSPSGAAPVLCSLPASSDCGETEMAEVGDRLDCDLTPGNSGFLDLGAAEVNDEHKPLQGMRAYVCPWLMWVQFALMKCYPFGRPVRAQDGRLLEIMPAGHGVEVQAWWPAPLILAEMRLRNWLVRQTCKLLLPLLVKMRSV